MDGDIASTELYQLHIFLRDSCMTFDANLKTQRGEQPTLLFPHGLITAAECRSTGGEHFGI
jgi:hypothetical protein